MEIKDYSDEELEEMDKDEVIRIYRSEQNEYRKKLDEYNTLLKDRDLQLMYVQEQLSNQKQQRFGRSTESSTSLIQQMDLFNEAEATVDSIKVIKEPSAEQVVKGYVRKRKGKRAEDLKGLPVKRVDLRLTDAQLQERFPDGYKELPEEIFSRLHYVPAKLINIEYHVHVYRAVKGHGIERAERPADLLKRSLVTPSLLAGILNYKYVNSLPLNRIEQEFKRNGFNLGREVMCSWVIRCTERYLTLLHDRMRLEMMKSHCLHADETPINVQKDGRPAGAKSYFWVYRTEAQLEHTHDIILYEYQKTRNSSHPQQFLEGFHGVLMTDAYSGYHTLDRNSEDITVQNCWVHARRPFSNVMKAKTDQQNMSVAEEAYNRITELFNIERTLKELPAEKRLKKRQELMKPKTDELFQWAREQSETVLPKSETGKGLTYLLNQEKYLCVFLYDPTVPMTNNTCEQGLRIVTIGRKNFMTIDTVSGAQSSAVCYSIAETAKANGLSPYAYFCYVLTEIPKHMEDKDLKFLDSLMPWDEKIKEHIDQNQEDIKSITAVRQ
jgi:transposase